MTRSREITVIPWKRKEEEILHFHCSTPGHDSVRLVEIPDKVPMVSFRLWAFYS